MIKFNVVALMVGDTAKAVVKSNDYWTEYNDYYNRIIQFRQNDGTIRVWYSSSPSSLCGLLQMIYLLKDFNCKISVVKLPSYSSTEPFRPLSSWGEIHPEAISKYYVEKKLAILIIDFGIRCAIYEKKNNSYDRC